MNPRDAHDAALLEPGDDAVPQVELGFVRDADGATFMRRQRVGYPFHVGRHLKMSGDPPGMPTVYLQSCSGGVFGGDDLRLRFTASEGAAAHVATAAATVVHSMESGAARQTVELHAGDGSLLEYLPDALIMFPRARLSSAVRIKAHPGATLIVSASVLLHDPKGRDERFDWLRAETMIEDAQGSLLARDRLQIDGAQLARGLAGLAGPWTAQASLYVVSRARGAAELAAALRGALDVPGTYAGATILPNQCGAWARILATDAAALHEALFCAWAALRQILTGAAPTPRRK